MTEEKEAITRDPDSLRDGGSPAARLVAGIAAGIVGGILMIGFLMAYASLTGAGLTMPLKAIGAVVYGVEAFVAGPVALLTGASIQLGFAIVLGMLFALCVSPRTSTVSALFAVNWHRYRSLAANGPACAAACKCDYGGARRAHSARVFQRTCPVRAWPVNNAHFHAHIHQRARLPSHGAP
jgi:hypothetical protein